MWKGIYGIFSNIGYSNNAIKAKFKKLRLKRKRFTDFVIAFSTKH